MKPLHEHNQKTYKNICRMYNEGIQRIAVVQPTGSGKSLLMGKLIEDNPDSRFFVLSTSHKINDQFKEKLDEEMLKRLECNIYCNMPNMKKEDMEVLQPDYILLDEMHRALAREWSKGIKVLLEMYPNAKVLGLSATPIRYLDKRRNVVKELFNDNLACDMNLSQAILDGILPMARYVCGVYSYEKDAESLNKKIERSYNSEDEKKELLKQVKILKENLDKGNGVSDIFRKYIMTGNEKFVVFLKDTKHLRRMRPVIKKWFNDAGFSSVRMYEVHSKNIDKDKEFQAFKNDTEEGIKLCLSVNMVAEGIHGDINGVIMLRETISPNLYFQMIGRAFACDKKIIPLIFDLVANSQFISETADNFPNELRGEIERRKKECEKEGKEYEIGFDVDEFIVMDQFMDVVSGFKEIEGRLEGKEWTEEEDDILKKWYPIEGIKVINRLKGRTRDGIYGRAKKINLNAPDKKWTKGEDDILYKYYPQYGRRTIDFLPHKTISSITCRANELGLYVERCNVFSEEEDEIIKKYYPIEGLEVYRRLNNKSKKQCSKRVRSLNIAQNKKWTKEQDKILCEWYPKEGGEVHKRIPGKTLNACQQRARKLNVGRYDWDDDKIELFMTLLKNETNLKVIAKKMASSVGTIKKMMKELGVTCRKRKHFSSRYKFVHYDRTRKKYDVSINVNGKMLHFGRYESEEEAAKVALEKAKEYGKAI